ncbi:MAG: ROK family protein [Candidatus Sericytochromatia bacterium]|nr:ROK family protein [Candidatus Sericytochromatia bacterium]
MLAGVDVGGTSLSVVLATPGGKVLGRAKGVTPPPQENPQPVLDLLDQLLAQCAERSGRSLKELDAMGLGIPGAVDRKGGRVTRAVNLGWNDVPLVDLLQRRHGVPVTLANDVQVAIEGEHRFGAAKGAEAALGIWIGTGIGGGLIQDGRLYTGASGAAGEIGHMVVASTSEPCGCGRIGCVEALASRTAIERHIRALMAAGRACAVPRLLEERGRIRITAGILKRALQEGDSVVQEALAAAQIHIGTLVTNLINLLDPEVIVLGGGIVQKLGDSFVQPIRERSRAATLRGWTGDEGPRVVASVLGDDAGPLGAAALAGQALKSRD